MKKVLDGRAIVYCEGAFNTSNGKTANGLVRFTNRYEVMAVIDSRYAGCDAGKILVGIPNRIPILAGTEDAIRMLNNKGIPADYFVIGLAPDGGRLPKPARQAVQIAISHGLNIDSGLHDFLSEDEKLEDLAAYCGVEIRDIRKTPPREELHFFSGKIEKVRSLKVAVLGTDSAIGKRTTAWKLIHGLRHAGISAEMIGTGQTSWMQGAKYSIILDSLIHDFVSGEIEHAVYSAWSEQEPEVIVIEGQGSLLNPAYPGGYEILAAGRPDIIILQHAPRRKTYDGFPKYPIHPLQKQIEAIELISEKLVVAITLNHERMTKLEIAEACRRIRQEVDRPVFDVLIQGVEDLVEVVGYYLDQHDQSSKPYSDDPILEFE